MKNLVLIFSLILGTQCFGQLKLEYELPSQANEKIDSINLPGINFPYLLRSVYQLPSTFKMELLDVSLEDNVTIVKSFKISLPSEKYNAFKVHFLSKTTFNNDDDFEYLLAFYNKDQDIGYDFELWTNDGQWDSVSNDISIGRKLQDIYVSNSGKPYNILKLNLENEEKIVLSVSGDKTMVFNLNGQVPVNEIEAQKVEVKAYPVPAKDQINFEYNLPEKATLEIYDLTGKKLIEKKFFKKNGKKSIDVSMLPSGSYIYNFQGKNKSFKSDQLIIQ